MHMLKNRLYWFLRAAYLAYFEIHAEKKILHIFSDFEEFRKVGRKNFFSINFLFQNQKIKNKGNIKGLLNICILMYTVFIYT